MRVTVCCEAATPAPVNSTVIAVFAVPIIARPLTLLQKVELAGAECAQDRRMVPAPVAPSRKCARIGVCAVAPVARQTVTVVATCRTVPPPAAREAVACVAVAGVLVTDQVEAGTVRLIPVEVVAVSVDAEAWRMLLQLVPSKEAVATVMAPCKVDMRIRSQELVTVLKT